MIPINLDKAGICASGFCAVHCSITPLVLLNAGHLKLFSLLHNPILEWLLFSIAVLMGAMAILPALLKHKKTYVLVLFLSGLFLVIQSELIQLIAPKILFSLLGGTLMAYAHFENLKLK